MKLPRAFFGHIRNQVRVSDVVKGRTALKQKGREFSGLCPFHDEKSPSFTVNDQKQFYHCFGCGAHGDVIKFVAETRGLSVTQAAVIIANENGIEVPKMTTSEERKYEKQERLEIVLELVADFYAGNLSGRAMEYLVGRGLKPKTIKSFNLGYADNKSSLMAFASSKSISEIELHEAGLLGRNQEGGGESYAIFTHRIIFPIKNIFNKVIAFGGRALGNSPAKYINSPETLIFKKNRHLYGQQMAVSKAYKSGYMILVEGYMDVIALHEAGFDTAVAGLGTAFSIEQLNSIWKTCPEIIVCLDGDSAGVRARQKLTELALPEIGANNSVSFVCLQSGQDPDDVIKSAGAGGFAKLIDNRLSLSESIWQDEFFGKEFTTPEQRSRLEKSLALKVSSVKDADLSYNMKRFFKDQVWQKIIRNRGKKVEAPLSQHLKNLPAHSQSEVIEYALCYLVASYSSILDEYENYETIASMNFSCRQAIALKEELLEIYDKENTINYEIFEAEAKSASDGDKNMLLLNTGKNFLNLDFIDKVPREQQKENLQKTFNLMHKKHYLMQLQQDYLNICQQINMRVDTDSSISASVLNPVSTNDDALLVDDALIDTKNQAYFLTNDEINSKLKAFLMEIQKVQKELQVLSMELA